MAVFGAPDGARGRPAARRPCRASACCDGCGAGTSERDPAERLELRIGVNTGEAIAAGTAGADLLVTGDAVNVAARLEQAAEPGTILIGERTARAVRGDFALREVERLRLKGKAEPVAAWLVEAERETPEPRGVPGVSAPLVGREHELELLRTTFERVRTGGRAHLVTLLGDAGVGKSRLVRELLSALDGTARVLVGRCLPYGQGITLWPLAEILKSEAGILDTDPSSVALAKLEQLVERELGEGSAAEHTVAALASTLGLRPPGDPLGALDPREAYRQLVAAWRALLVSIARRASVVVVVEDIHWADATMLDVLDELAERVEGPIFFLCPARPDLLRTRPDWGGGRRSFSSLPLDPLTAEQSARLVSSLLDVDLLPETVRDRILERSEGNPFFLEEIVHHLIDEGLLVATDGRWRAVAGIDEVEIPDTVQAVLLARLDLLAPEEKRVAQRAAVVGRVFWDGAVERLAGVDDVDAALQTLRRRELVLDRSSSALAGQNEFIFKHVLIRDVAYASLPRRERGRAHAELATWIEATSGERSAEFAELLAHHCDAAFTLVGDDELRRRARGHFLAAADGALHRFAIPQSERLAQRAVELSTDGSERVEALEALGDLHNRTFNGDGAWRAYRDALAALPPGDPAIARLAGKAGLFGARWLGTVFELPPAAEVREILDLGLAAAGPRRRSRAHAPARRSRLPHPPTRGVGRRDSCERRAGRRGRRGASRRPGPPVGRARPRPGLGAVPGPSRGRVPRDAEAVPARRADDGRQGDRRLARDGGGCGPVPRPLRGGRGRRDGLCRARARPRLRLVRARADVACHVAVHARRLGGRACRSGRARTARCPGRARSAGRVLDARVLVRGALPRAARRGRRGGAVSRARAKVRLGAPACQKSSARRCASHGRSGHGAPRSPRRGGGAVPPRGEDDPGGRDARAQLRARGRARPLGRRRRASSRPRGPRPRSESSCRCRSSPIASKGGPRPPPATSRRPSSSCAARPTGSPGSAHAGRTRGRGCCSRRCSSKDVEARRSASCALRWRSSSGSGRSARQSAPRRCSPA